MADPRDLLPDELPAHAVASPQTFYEEGPHAGDAATGSTKVGWTLRDSHNRILQGFAFLINPQGLTRTHGSRGTLNATKGGHYVDDFGPGAGRIQLRQLVASGKEFPGGFYTAREDVQRWLKLIYLPATAGANRGKRRVFFHDHHFERGFEEHVFFPPDALTIDRATDLHGVWRLDLQMLSLEKYPYGEVKVQSALPKALRGRQYIVKKGDTIDKLARALAGGARASAAKVTRVRAALLKVNPQLRHKRKLPNGAAGAKPLRLYPGELLRLPS